MVWVAPPVDTAPAARQYRESPQEAVRLLTDDIGRALDARLFQTDTFRDRELMLRLERIYSGERRGRQLAGTAGATPAL